MYIYICLFIYICFIYLLIYIYLFKLGCDTLKATGVSPGSMYTEKSRKNIVKQKLIATYIYSSQQWYRPLLDKWIFFRQTIVGAEKNRLTSIRYHLFHQLHS